jgi:hypothetical protein
MRRRKLSTPKKKAECDACTLVRTVTVYEASLPDTTVLPERDRELCDSCASVHFIDELQSSAQGRMLLMVNSKLDMLLGKDR